MRRYLQFRLRILFVLTTLAAVACMIVPPAVERYREYQREQERKLLQRYLDAATHIP